MEKKTVLHSCGVGHALRGAVLMTYISYERLYPILYKGASLKVHMEIPCGHMSTASAKHWTDRLPKIEFIN